MAISLHSFSVLSLSPTYRYDVLRDIVPHTQIGRAIVAKRLPMKSLEFKHCCGLTLVVRAFPIQLTSLQCTKPMDHLHLDGLLAFPSIISLAEINGMNYLLLPVHCYQQPGSSIDEYFNFNQCVSKKLWMIFPTHHILEGYTKQPASKIKYDDLIYIIFF